MTERHLLVLTLLSIFALNAVKPDDTTEALKKILEELNSKNSHDEGNPKLYHSRHKHEYYKHGRDLLNSPKLMNVKNMNLFLKPNKRRIVNDLTRTGSENACKGGICGCIGTRCGGSRDDNLADEVDRVVNEINRKLAAYDDEYRNDVDRVDGNERTDSDDNRIVKDIVEYFDKIKKEDKYDGENDIVNQERDDDDDNDTKQESDDNDGDDLERKRHILFSQKDRLDKNEFINKKRIKVNDNLEVVIVEKSDLDKLLRNKAFIDLTRNDVDIDVENDDDDKEILLKAFQKYEKFIAEEDKTGRTANFISPEDLFSLYESVKDNTVTQVLGYVKNKRPLNLKHITPTQIKKLQNLKMKYKRREIKEAAVQEKIVRILFGIESKAKVVAHKVKNNYIFIPKWIYERFLSTKKTFNNSLRVKGQKRILPLTFQQKERLYNKEKVKTIPKLVWRKNSGQDIQRYGIPFELEVHGLGQVAP